MKRLIRAVKVRLSEGLYNADDLKRWFDCLADDDSPEGRMLQIDVMRLASTSLSSRAIDLERLRPFDDVEVMGSEYIDLPIVVIGDLAHGPLELADGRHRVKSARDKGVKSLLAVSIAKK